jgi:hypothetical protein
VVAAFPSPARYFVVGLFGLWIVMITILAIVSLLGSGERSNRAMSLLRILLGRPEPPN